MNLSKALVVVVLGLGCAAAAHGQVGVYGTYSATRMSGIQCLSSAVACANGASAGTSSSTGTVTGGGTGSLKPSGLMGGIYYDFKDVGPVRLGIDVRGGTSHANKSASTSAGGDNIAGASTVLVGVRGVFKVKPNWLRPYAQASIGYARSNATEPLPGILSTTANPNPPRTSDNFVQYEFFGGLDVRVLPLIDLRAIELGIGGMSRLGSGQGTGTVGVQSIGAGIVFHLPVQ